jgi:hypothetical protein
LLPTFVAMKKIDFYIATFCCILFLACQQKNKTNTPTFNKDSSEFVPAIALLKTDIETIKRNPYFIYKTTEIKGHKKDSIPLTNDMFLKEIAPILQCDIATIQLKNKYKEVSFLDKSTNSTTFIYTALDTNLLVKSQTILLDQDNNSLKRLSISTFINNPDSSIATSYYWKAKKSLLITKVIVYKNGKEKQIKQLINWNDLAY